MQILYTNFFCKMMSVFMVELMKNFKLGNVKLLVDLETEHKHS
jgi:hypothetical protein